MKHVAQLIIAPLLIMLVASGVYAVWSVSAKSEVPNGAVTTAQVINPGRAVFTDAMGAEHSLELREERRPGTELKVIYDATDPGTARVFAGPPAWVLGTAFTSGGLAVLLLGASMLRKVSSGVRYETRLRRDGDRLVATVTKVEPMNPGDPSDTRFRVVAQGEHNGQQRTFFSDWLGHDPTTSLAATGGTVAVMVDPANPALYLVDTSRL